MAMGVMANNSLAIETHTTTPMVETFGLRVIGSNVDVNQQMNFSISANGTLNISISHGTYPSIKTTGIGNAEKSSQNLYQYQAQSFMFTHGLRYIPMLTIASPAAAAEQAYTSYNFQQASNKLNASYKLLNKATFGGFNAGN